MINSNFFALGMGYGVQGMGKTSIICQIKRFMLNNSYTPNPIPYTQTSKSAFTIYSNSKANRRKYFMRKLFFVIGVYFAIFATALYGQSEIIFSCDCPQSVSAKLYHNGLLQNTIMPGDTAIRSVSNGRHIFRIQVIDEKTQNSVDSSVIVNTHDSKEYVKITTKRRPSGIVIRNISIETKPLPPPPDTIPIITIVNNIGYAVKKVFISPSTDITWGQNRLAATQILYSRQSITLDLPYPLNQVKQYDIMIKDSKNDTYKKENILITANSRVVFTLADIEPPLPHPPLRTPPHPRTSKQPSINLGIGGMYNHYIGLDNKIYNDVHEGDKRDTMPKVSWGISIGPAIRFSFTDIVSLNSEFYYSYKRFGSSRCSNNCTKVIEHALDIPLLIKLSPKIFDDVNSSVYIEGGVFWGIPLNTTVKAYNSDTYIDREKRDFGYLFGIGANVYFLDFGLRFVVNTSDFAKDSKTSLWSGGIVIKGWLL